MIKTLLKYRYLNLVILMIIVVLALIKAPFIEIDTDISQFFHEDDKDYHFYQEMKTEFSNSDNVILVGIKNTSSVFDTNFLKRVLIFSDSLDQIKGVNKVTSLLNLSYPTRSMFGIIGVPYIQTDDQNKISYSKDKIIKDELTRSFINSYGDTLFLWSEFDEDLATADRNRLIADINSLRSEFSDLDTYLWGREVIDVSFKNILVKEIMSFSFWIFIFLCLSLIFIFKKPIALLFPILLVLIVIALFLGGMVYLNRPMSTMSNLFPTIILIVAVSDVIHLCIKYDMEWKKGLSSAMATNNALKEIGWTTLITSFTTAVGFLVLCLSPMQAMRNFGLESAILVIITYLLTLIFLPIFFIGIRNSNLFTIRLSFETFFSKLFKKLEKIYQSPKTTLVVFGLLFVLCTLGVFLINTDTKHYSISKKSDLYKNYKFFEGNFGGSRTFELILLAKNDRVLNEPDLLKTVYNIHDYLTDNPYLNLVRSPVNYYQAIHQAYYPSKHKDIPLPQDDKTIRKYEKELSKTIKKDYLSNKERSIFKFNAQMFDYGRHEIESINEEIMKNVNHYIKDKPMEAQLSGIDMLIDISQKKSIRNMFIGLLTAIIVVSITLGLVFKNKALAILAVLLNIIPLLMAAGIMGYANLDLRAEISLIFTVGFVIAVDDTIHLLSKFQWERKAGNNIEEALRTAVLESGKAIVATSIILVGGFFILMTSGSLEIFTLGLLVGIIVLITLAVDLILAPIIILKWFRNYL